MITKINLYLSMMILMLALLGACQDPPPSWIEKQDTFNLPQNSNADMQTQMDMSPISLVDQWMDRTDIGLQKDMLVEPKAAWLEMSFSPSKIYYRLNEEPTIEVAVFDQYAQRVEIPVDFEIMPMDRATITMAEDGTVSVGFLTEGDLMIKACVAANHTESESIECVERALIIDDSLPQMTIHWPTRGGMITGEDAWPTVQQQGLPEGTVDDMEHPAQIGMTIPVYGEVLDSQENLIVKVNQERVEVNQGRFFTVVPASFGYNRIEVIADDQIRNQLVRDVRWVLWSPVLGEFLEDRSRIDDGLRFRLDQTFLDNNVIPNTESMPLVLTELAELLSVIIDLLDPIELIPNPNLIQSESFSLSIEDITLGEPLVDLRFTEQGISLFVGLDQLNLQTAGFISLADGNLSLDGSILLGAAAFAELELSSSADRPLIVSVIESAISITSVDANFEQASSEALIEALDTQARLLISDLVTDIFEEIITQQIPPLLENSVNSIFNTVRELPLNLDASSLGLPTLSLSMIVTPEDIQSQESKDAELSARVELIHNNPIMESNTARRGYPSIESQDDLPNQSNSFSLHLRFDVINALLAEIWRGGLLSLTPPLPTEAMALVSEAYVEALAPPIIKVANIDSSDPLALQIAGLMVQLTGNFAPETDEYEVFIEADTRLVIEGGNFSFLLEDEPEIQVVIAKQRNDAPVASTELLKTIFLYSIWPSLSQSLTEQIELGLSSSSLYPADFASLGINLTSGIINPIFLDRLKTSGGWISLEGGIEVELNIAP